MRTLFKVLLGLTVTGVAANFVSAKLAKKAEAELDATLSKSPIWQSTHPWNMWMKNTPISATIGRRKTNDGQRPYQRKTQRQFR